MHLDFPSPVKHKVSHFSYQLAIHQSFIHFPPPLPVVYIKKNLWTNNSFIDFGVESLLSLAISGRFREELGLDKFTVRFSSVFH